MQPLCTSDPHLPWSLILSLSWCDRVVCPRRPAATKKKLRDLPGDRGDLHRAQGGLHRGPGAALRPRHPLPLRALPGHVGWGKHTPIHMCDALLIFSVVSAITPLVLRELLEQPGRAWKGGVYRFFVASVGCVPSRHGLHARACPTALMWSHSWRFFVRNGRYPHAAAPARRHGRKIPTKTRHKRAHVHVLFPWRRKTPWRSEELDAHTSRLTPYSST